MNTDLKQNTLEKLNSKNIIELIYTIRGKRVMLDRDLAKFYQVKPFRLREQVKRNIKRFPDDFMFQLTEIEVDSMVSQFAIPSRQVLGGALPYAFTEQGVAAISSVLNTERAIVVSIMIMRTFVHMRKLSLANEIVHLRLNKLEMEHDETNKKIDDILNAMDNKAKFTQGIFYKGQIFDAYTFVANLIRSADRSLILIDNFVDDTVLTLFKKRKNSIKLEIITRKISKEFLLDIKKHQAQYSGITIRERNDFHDRFLIIDNKDIYHFGASLKDLGKKCFAFNKLDKELSTLLLEYISK